MKENTKIDYTQNIENFVKTYVTLENLQLENWYETAFIQCDTIGKIFDVPVYVVVAMVAICSPLVAWDTGENINTVVNIIKTAKNIENDGKFSGFSRNVNKARQLFSDFQNGIVKTENEASAYVTGPKVSRFFHNILHFSTSTEITVDVWMYRIAVKNWVAATNVCNMTSKQQNDIRLAYVDVWQKLGLAKYNVNPNMFQATLWGMIKQKDIAFSWFNDFENIVNFK